MAKFTLASAGNKARELMEAKTVQTAHVVSVGPAIAVRALRWQPNGGDWATLSDDAEDITAQARA